MIKRLSDQVPEELSHDMVISKEIERVQGELKEIGLLIKQSTSEVETLTNRHNKANQVLSRIKSHLDSTPREDIMEAHEAVADAVRRLFTMRGQLEKLQSQHERADRHLSVLKQIQSIEPQSGGRRSVKRLTQHQTDSVTVVEAQESERRRLSRAMHDGPAQSMTNFILQAEICQRLFDKDPERARTELVGLKTAATDAFEEVREFIFELRPMMLDDLGLMPTVRQYVDNYKRRSMIPVELVMTGQDRRLPRHIEVTVFRLIQELLTNVREHSQATQARITLMVEDDLLSASVEDNGVGFKPDELLSASGDRPIGIATMPDRVRIMGGTVDIESSPGKGARIGISIPLEKLGSE